jgi:hypothetical protein
MTSHSQLPRPRAVGVPALSGSSQTRAGVSDMALVPFGGDAGRTGAVAGTSPAATDQSAEIDRLRADKADLLAALKCFLGDERFHVAIGGNPNAVDKMLAFARAAVAKAEGSAP